MPLPNKKKRIERLVQTQAPEAKALVQKIHGLAEPAFQETESAKLIADYLAGNGFRVTFDFPNIPTAFRAVRGQGKPAIGVLGEYDALPNCGPTDGQWGHGCGHNLLGVGSAVAAVAAAQLATAAGLRGRVVYYGCPAEETMAGKVYMARDGAFRDLDACLAWHPGGSTGVNNAGGAALDSWVFEFHGRTAHGASAHGGRSALDAAILFDVAVNYLREHVPENVRIHSVIRDGGDAPNVVPAFAKSWYYVRGADRRQVDEVVKRLTACAKGAAMATETRLKRTRLTAAYSRLPNDAAAALAFRNAKLFGPPTANAADAKRAKALGLKGEFNLEIDKGFGTPGRASSDEDTVSWLAPLARFSVACSAKGSPGHHRDYAAQMTFPFAHRGTLQAAKMLAGTAVDLLADRDVLRRVTAEFRKRTKNFSFDPLIPKRQPVPIEAP